MTERAPAPYELIEHTADLGFRVTAPEPARLFARAILALEDLMADSAAARPVAERTIDVTGSDPGDALVRALEEALYLFEAERLLLSEIAHASFDATAHRFRATARGEPFDPARHELRRPVKAVTYHDLAVERTDEGWRARVILDL
jgi:SHS2 domain-containing protein